MYTDLSRNLFVRNHSLLRFIRGKVLLMRERKNSGELHTTKHIFLSHYIHYLNTLASFLSTLCSSSSLLWCITINHELVCFKRFMPTNCTRILELHNHKEMILKAGTKITRPPPPFVVSWNECAYGTKKKYFGSFQVWEIVLYRAITFGPKHIVPFSRISTYGLNVFKAVQGEWDEEVNVTW